MAMPPNLEPEGKGQDGKDRSSAKKSKANSGNAGMAGAKAGESGKATSGSGNDGASQRCTLWHGFLGSSWQALVNVFLFFSTTHITDTLFDCPVVLKVDLMAHRTQVTRTNRYVWVIQVWTTRWIFLCGGLRSSIKNCTWFFQDISANKKGSFDQMLADGMHYLSQKKMNNFSGANSKINTAISILQSFSTGETCGIDAGDQSQHWDGLVERFWCNRRN